MQRRTNEAMNGLSSRLDKMLDQASKNALTQSKQQRTMAALTLVISVATVAYTATTIYATNMTARGPQTVYVSGAGPVPESAAVHVAIDAAGQPFNRRLLSVSSSAIGKA
jgi:hypothetical protein